MSALFNFQALLVVILLLICTCAYIHETSAGKSLLDRHKQGFTGVFWKSARIGERLSPYIAISCVAMALSILLF